MNTRHAQERIGQRGFGGGLIDIVKYFGEWVGDRQILTTRELDRIIAQQHSFLKRLERLRAKGGATTVHGKSDELITVFANAARRRGKFRSGRNTFRTA